MGLGRILLLYVSSHVWIACAGPKKVRMPDAAPVHAPVEDGVNGAEHCLKKNLCFLEIDQKGRSSFYADDSRYAALVFDPGFTALNVEVKKVSQAEYGAIKKSSFAATVSYGASVDIFQNNLLANNADANSRFQEKQNVFKDGFALGSIYNVAITLMGIPSYAAQMAPLAKSINGRGTASANFPVSFHIGDKVVPSLVTKPAKKNANAR